MAFNYKKYKQAQYTQINPSPFEKNGDKKSILSKVWKGGKKIVGKTLLPFTVLEATWDTLDFLEKYKGKGDVLLKDIKKNVTRKRNLSDWDKHTMLHWNW